MPTLKLTKDKIEKIEKIEGKQALHWDAELKGFGVLVSGVTDTKTYIVQRRMPTAGPDASRSARSASSSGSRTRAARPVASLPGCARAWSRRRNAARRRRATDRCASGSTPT